MRVTGAVHQGLKHVAAGYVDERVVLVRKLLREGKNCEQIAREICSTRYVVRAYILRLGLPLPVNAQTERQFDRSWYAEAIRLRSAKVSRAEIAAAVGKTPGAVSSLFCRIDNGLLDLEKIGASA